MPRGPVGKRGWKCPASVRSRGHVMGLHPLPAPSAARPGAENPGTSHPMRRKKRKILQRRLHDEIFVQGRDPITPNLMRVIFEVEDYYRKCGAMRGGAVLALGKRQSKKRCECGRASFGKSNGQGCCSDMPAVVNPVQKQRKLPIKNNARDNALKYERKKMYNKT